MISVRVTHNTDRHSTIVPATTTVKEVFNQLGLDISNMLTSLDGEGIEPTETINHFGASSGDTVMLTAIVKKKGA